jgi:hypothetical protein
LYKQSPFFTNTFQLDNSNDVNKPQIGPLLMDIRHQRHLILAAILGLDPELPTEHVSLTAKQMFINNLVSILLRMF